VNLKAELTMRKQLSTRQHATRLRNRLLVYFLLLALIPFSAASFIAYTTVRDGAREGAIREMTSLANSSAQAVNLYMSDRVSDLAAWARLRIVREALELSEVREEATDFLRELVKQHPAFAAVLVLDPHGTCVASSWHGFIRKNFSQESLFADAVPGHVHIQDMHKDERLVAIDPDLQGWNVTISVPVKRADQVVGVMCAFLKWAEVEAILGQVKIGTTGYVYMANSKREIIAHPSRALYHQSIAGSKLNLPGLSEAMKRKEPYHEYRFQNVKTQNMDDKIVGLAYPGGFDRFEGLGWIFGAGADSREIMGFLPKIVRNLAMVGIIIVIVVVLLALYFARGIARPVAAVANQVARAGEGDLTVDIPEMKRADEIGSLVRTFKVMLENLRAQIRETLQGVTILTESAERIQTTVSEVAHRASESSSAVTRTTEIVQEVKEAAVAGAERVRNVSDQAAAIADAGRESIERTMEQMSVINDNMTHISESVSRLSEHGRAIDEIVNAVQDLAARSNLLAVNASIEAARAGESGRGFAIVAHEIKSLSDQSKSSTGRVRHLLDEIRESVVAVSAASDAAHVAVADGLAQTRRAGESIQSLAQSVAASSDAANLMESSSDRQVAGLDEISESITNVEQIVKDNAGSARQLEDSAIKLNELGQQLTDVVKRYRVQ
jgi:methyl-accepting chemotaxis protein